MFTRDQLLEKINNPGLGSGDIAGVLKSWRIDPIYEDDENNEYYDEMAISKLRHAIKLKDQGKGDDEISSIVNNGIINPISAPAIRNTQVMSEPPRNNGNGLNNITLDVTSQTLSMLAESIAQKITGEITDKLKNSDIFQPVMDSAKIKRDNEILSQQVDQLLEENKKLLQRNSLLQKENSKFRHLVGQLYVKHG